MSDAAKQIIADAKTFTAAGALQIGSVQTNKAPSLTTTERDALVGIGAGTIILNSTTGKLNFYDGAAWLEIATTA